MKDAVFEALRNRRLDVAADYLDQLGAIVCWPPERVYSVGERRSYLASCTVAALIAFGASMGRTPDTPMR